MFRENFKQIITEASSIFSSIFFFKIPLIISQNFHKNSLPVSLIFHKFVFFLNILWRLP